MILILIFQGAFIEDLRKVPINLSDGETIEVGNLSLKLFTLPDILWTG